MDSARAYANLRGKERKKQTNEADETKRNVRQSARHSVSSHILTRIMILILRLPPWDQGIGVLGGLKGSDKGPGEFSSSEDSNRNNLKEVLSLAAQALPCLALTPGLGEGGEILGKVRSAYLGSQTKTESIGEPCGRVVKDAAEGQDTKVSHQGPLRHLP